VPWREVRHKDQDLESVLAEIWEIITSRSIWVTEDGDEEREWEGARTRKRGRTEHLIGARPGPVKNEGTWLSLQRGAIFGAVLVASGNGGKIC
jgi:hypothetical protein